MARHLHERTRSQVVRERGAALLLLVLVAGGCAWAVQGALRGSLDATSLAALVLTATCVPGAAPRGRRRAAAGWPPARTALRAWRAPRRPVPAGVLRPSA